MSFPKGVIDVLLVISNNNDIAMENKHLHTNSCFVTFLEKHSSFFLEHFPRIKLKLVCDRLEGVAYYVFRFIFTGI